MRMKAMSQLVFTIAALMFLFGSSVFAGPNVSNVRATQQAQTNLVDIFYDLSATNNGPFTVTVAVSTNGGADYTLPATSVTGNGVGNAVTPGVRKKIVWDAGRDWPGKYSSEVKFRVTADENQTAGDYMVIDLSGGTNASSYPVTYLTAVPPGGWTDEYKTTKLVMRRIPAGSFTMGSPTNELGHDSDENQHQVTLTKDFYIGVFEVTQKQWERVMGTWPSYFSNVIYRDTRPVEQVSYYQIRENPSNIAISPSWPQSSQVHAESFVGKLRDKSGLVALDLPTEAQWEYACRAGSITALNSGQNLTNLNTDTSMDNLGRYRRNHPGGYSSSSNVSTDGGTAKVGSYQENAWGLYDMHGNVREWCLDWYGMYSNIVENPSGPESGVARVFRGGTWLNNAWLCRSARRASSFPTNKSDYGFRLVRNMP